MEMKVQEMSDFFKCLRHSIRSKQKESKTELFAKANFLSTPKQSDRSFDKNIAVAKRNNKNYIT